MNILRSRISIEQIFEDYWFQSRKGKAIKSIGFVSACLDIQTKNSSAIIQLKKRKALAKDVSAKQHHSVLSQICQTLDQIRKLYSLNCFSLAFMSVDNLITPLTFILCNSHCRLIYKLFQGDVNNALRSIMQEVTMSKPKSKFSG